MIDIDALRRDAADLQRWIDTQTRPASPPTPAHERPAGGLGHARVSVARRTRYRRQWEDPVGTTAARRIDAERGAR